MVEEDVPCLAQKFQLSLRAEHYPQKRPEIWGHFGLFKPQLRLTPGRPGVHGPLLHFWQIIKGVTPHRRKQIPQKRRRWGRHLRGRTMRGWRKRLGVIRENLDVQGHIYRHGCHNNHLFLLAHLNFLVRNLSINVFVSHPTKNSNYFTQRRPPSSYLYSFSRWFFCTFYNSPFTPRWFLVLPMDFLNYPPIGTRFLP